MKEYNTLYNKIFGFININELMINIAVAVLIFLIFRVISMVVNKKSHFIATKVFRAKSKNTEDAITASFFKPISLFLHVTGIFLAVRTLPFAAGVWVTLWPVLIKAYRIATIIIVCMALVSFAGNMILFSARFSDNINKTVMSFISKLLKGAIVVLAVAAFLKELNFDISGLVAGLGLSGVVLALAAQDTASNFFSGVVILLDKPFDIGDWISVGNMEGVVEEMNFRSCRIRTFDNALISVPNNKLSSDSIINWQRMGQRKTKIIFGVTYSTDKEAIMDICRDIRQCLSGIDNIDKDKILVWFDSFNASSLDIGVQYFSSLISFKDYVQIKEQVMYNIMDIVKKYGSDFAFDTKTIIIENQ